METDTPLIRNLGQKSKGLTVAVLLRTSYVIYCYRKLMMALSPDGLTSSLQFQVIKNVIRTSTAASRVRAHEDYGGNCCHIINKGLEFI